MSELVTHSLSHLQSLGSLHPKVTKSNAAKDFEFYGVSMKDIRTYAKTIKPNHALALALFETNVYEALMLGAILLEPSKLTLDDAVNLVSKAKSSYIVDQGLSDIVLASNVKHEVLNHLIENEDAHLRYGGYALISAYFRKEALEVIDVNMSLHALELIKTNIHNETLDIQNAMNNAVVMAGLHVPTLVKKAVEVATHIGYIVPRERLNKCNIQSALDYLHRYSDQPTYSRVAKLKK